MDDLEKAILYSFYEQGNVDPSLKSQALSICQEIKNTPSICSLCVQKLLSCKLPQVQFWCLQTLQEILRGKYTVMSTEEKNYIRNSVFSMACLEVTNENTAARVLDSPAFIKNKLAQVLVTLTYYEYPLVWPSVFVDFLPHLIKGPVVIDMFCRVLNALDDELISFDYPRTSEEMAAAGRIKDAMREQCIPQIVHTWYEIVSLYRRTDQELCAEVLGCVRRYISWIDIGLIVNDAFLPLLFELIFIDGLSDQLRGAAAGCVLAVASKRMDPQLKLSLLQRLQMNRLFSLISGNMNSELLSEIAALLNGYAVEVLECYKRLNSEDGKTVSIELLNEVLPSVFYVMKSCEVDATFSIVQFLSGYVSTLKGSPALREKQIYNICQILEVIRMQICYDPVYRNNLDQLDKIGLEEEDRMSEFRKDLFVLLRTVGRVAPEATRAFIRNTLGAAVSSSSDRNVEEVEAALSLLYTLGESVTDEAMKSGAGWLTELIPMLLSMRLPGHSYRLVALVYLETITRYLKFIQEDAQHIPAILAAFLDERGLHHPNPHVSRRAGYLFMRVVKMLKAKLVPFIDKILQIQSLRETIAHFTSMNYTTKAVSGTEDGSHIFEAIGLLIGMEDVPVDKQSGYLCSLLTPLCQQIETLLRNAKGVSLEEYPDKIVNLQFYIMAINALSKGFSERLVTASRPGIGHMFRETMEVLLHILIEFPEVEPLRIKVMSFMHRMVETLGASVFPYLPKALEQLLAGSEPKEMVGILLLLNQLICKFKSAFCDILEKVYPTIAARVFSIISGDTFPPGSGPNTEEKRELRELQRTLFMFLHVIATHDLSLVFLNPKSRAYLEPMLELLLKTSCFHKDILVRKACVQIFIRLIKDWCTKPCNEEKVPGFRKFIIESFATKCCLFSVLEKSFEFTDANSLILFGEIVSAQKVMYESFGDDFLVHVLSNGLQQARCPQVLAEQYCQKLQGSDIKALKSFYQSLIENLRHHQNGSLVYR